MITYLGPLDSWTPVMAIEGRLSSVWQAQMYAVWNQRHWWLLTYTVAQLVAFDLHRPLSTHAHWTIPTLGRWSSFRHANGVDKHGRLHNILVSFFAFWCRIEIYTRADHRKRIPVRRIEPGRTWLTKRELKAVRSGAAGATPPPFARTVTFEPVLLHAYIDRHDHCLLSQQNRDRELRTSVTTW